MVKFILILLVFFLLPRKASAKDFFNLFGGDDAPSYKQVSPESTMTESQKAMQQYLTNLGKLGYEQGMQAFDPTRIQKGNAFYNAAVNAIQNGTSRTPQAINTTVAQTIASTPTATVKENKPSNFISDEILDEAVKQYDSQKMQAANRGRASFNQYRPSDGGGLGSVSSKAAIGLQQGAITPEMIEAYRRQKQAADDATLLANRGAK